MGVVAMAEQMVRHPLTNLGDPADRFAHITKMLDPRSTSFTRERFAIRSQEEPGASGMTGKHPGQHGEQGVDERDLTVLRILGAPLRFDAIEQLQFL